MKKILQKFLPILLPLLFISCSSQPKPQMILRDTYNLTNQIFQNANYALSVGKNSEAKKFLSQAYTNAVSIDSKELLCRISLSGIIYSLNTGLDTKKLLDNAQFPDYPARTLLAMAQEYAYLSEKKELLLSAISIYQSLILLSENASAQELKETLSRLDDSRASLSKDAYFTSFALRTSGDVNMAIKNYTEAEKFYRAAAESHLKNYFITEVGNDWYSLARCLSQDGKFEEAISAIDTALFYDKNAENTFAIASDYYGKALILAKNSRYEEAFNNAIWAQQVFSAGGFTRQAEVVRLFTESIVGK